MNSREPKVVTEDVVRLVDDYVSKALSDAEKYTNSTPLDESGIWSLQRLAADIYGLGFDAGERVEAARNRGQHMRERERASAATTEENING